MTREHPPIRTLKGLMKALNERVEEVLHDKFSWGTIEEIVMNTLENQVENIVAQALGFRRDSFDRSWRIDDNHNRSAVAERLTEMVAGTAERLLPKVIEKNEDAIVGRLTSAKKKLQIQSLYDRIFQESIHKAIQIHVAAQVETDIEELLQDEDFMSSLKLKNPITLKGDIVTIAGGPEQAR